MGLLNCYDDRVGITVENKNFSEAFISALFSFKKKRMPTLADLALWTIDRLSVELQTSIDAAAPQRSFGKVCLSPTDAVSTESEGGAVELDSFLSQETRAQCSVVENSLAYQHGLASGTMDDGEAAALRSLPRATLEILLLTALDVSKRRGDETALFGPVLGPSFRSYVECRCARKLATPGVELLQNRVTVRRGGVETTVAAVHVLEGDILVLRDGDRLPVDALLLDVADGRGSCSIDTTIIDGSCALLHRAFGSFVDCDRFGAASILPQQCGIHPTCCVRGVPVVATAIALRTAAASSWSLKLTTALAMKKPLFSYENPSSLYVPPFPAISVKQRHSVVGMAKAQVLIVDIDRLFVGEKSHVVDACVWDSRIFPERDVDRLWNYVPFSEKSNVSKSGSSSSSVHVSSFTFEEDASSRLSVRSPSDAFRELLIAGMLASCYPPSDLAVPRDEVSSEVGLRNFISSSRCRILEENFGKYVPLSEVTTVRVSAMDVSARLFGYNREAFANGYATDRHAVLVVWGPAIFVAKLASYGKTSKGQQKLTSKNLEFLQSCGTSAVAQPDLLIGIATADVLLDEIGMKRSPTDVSSLVSATLNLSYLGAFACNPSPPRAFVDGVQAVGEICAKSCCMVSFTQDEATLAFSLKRCGLQDVRVVKPDVLNRWKQEPPPVHRQACAFPLRGVKDRDKVMEEICAWLGRTRGLVFCASSSYGMLAMRLAHFAVGFVSEDKVTSSALEMLSDVTVRDWDLLQLVHSLHGAM
jgi:hypothetical protein